MTELPTGFVDEPAFAAANVKNADDFDQLYVVTGVANEPRRAAVRAILQ